MKILYLHQYFALPDSNAGTRSYDLAKQFIADGHEVIFIAGGGYINKRYLKNKGWNFIETGGLKGHIYNSKVTNKMNFSKRKFGFLKFAVFSTIKVLSIKCDLVLATSTPLTIAIPAIIKKILTRTPYIFEVRDLWPELPIAIGAIENPIIIFLAKLLEKTVYLLSSHIVTLSVDMKQSIIKRTATKEKKVSVITNIANIQRFQTVNCTTNLFAQKKLLKGKKIVLYAGTFGIINGISYLVYLAESVSKYSQEIVFVTLGEGMEKESVLALAKEKKLLGENFFCFNSVPKKELPCIMKNILACCSLFIDLPEMRANSANKYFDALAAGKPVVINYNGWQKQEVEQHQIGLVLSPKMEDMDNNARSLVAFLSDNEKIRRAETNALKLARNSYGLDIASKAYLQIIDRTGL